MSVNRSGEGPRLVRASWAFTPWDRACLYALALLLVISLLWGFVGSTVAGWVLWFGSSGS
jgi:hypothetical protein